MYFVLEGLILLLNLQSTYSDIIEKTFYYNPFNYNYTYNYNLKPIPTNSKYQSNNSCVTFADLIEYNYTDRPENSNNMANVFPENFCYSMLTYNISREDFFDIVNKNLQAFYNYRRLITLWSLYNYTSLTNMNDQCAGYFRNVACWTLFPACIDNGDQTWSASTICQDYCNTYMIRCEDFTVKTICDKTSPLDYCAGYLKSEIIHFSMFKLFVLIFLLIL